MAGVEHSLGEHTVNVLPHALEFWEAYQVELQMILMEHEFPEYVHLGGINTMHRLVSNIGGSLSKIENSSINCQNIYGHKSTRLSQGYVTFEPVFITELNPDINFLGKAQNTWEFYSVSVNDYIRSLPNPRDIDRIVFGELNSVAKWFDVDKRRFENGEYSGGDLVYSHLSFPGDTLLGLGYAFVKTPRSFACKYRG
ncbi:MAG: hypothetical protein NDI94_03365 [Candidatus Woesearchaeota archaeon]|nr:hypothetical protein [Candidatus Woesearchaeota archaeon]